MIVERDMTEADVPAHFWHFQSVGTLTDLNGQIKVHKETFKEGECPLQADVDIEELTEGWEKDRLQGDKRDELS